MPKLNKNGLILFLITLSIVFAFVSYHKGIKADVKGDYHIYWETGKNFISGQKIYTPGLADGGFTYPPFAAMLFSLFALFPFHISAFLYAYLIDYGLWVASFFLIKKIIDIYYPNRNNTLPLVLSMLLSIAFYWHNYMWMNANMPVLCTTLLGMLFYIRKRFNLSYLFFLAGAFFKITPVIFLFFAAIKRGPKDWPKIILMAVPFIIVPILFRGFSTGIQDWRDYYEAFVAPFSKGQIDENIISLGVPAMLNKLNKPDASIGYPAFIHLSAHVLKLLILVFQITVFGAVTLKFIYDKYMKHNEAFSAADFCIIFLIPLLLPGRVWAHHHVCAGFIYTYVFILLSDRKAVFGLTIFLCLLTNFMIKDVIGQSFAIW
jgi:hypothetical protein